MIISKKRFNALLNQQYLKGRKAGFHEGKMAAIRKKFTINEMRELMGLLPIENERK